MTKGRKTTFDERVEIVQYCIAHDHNYAKTAEQFGISYQQARNYTIKYENQGVEALRDRRGKRKPEVENENQKRKCQNSKSCGQKTGSCGQKKNTHKWRLTS